MNDSARDPARAAQEPRPAPGLRAQIISALIGGAGVRLAGVAVTFLVGVQLARYLGPAEYGVYGTVLAVTSICAAAAQVGLSPLLTRELAQLGSAEGNARGKAALIYFSISAVVLSLLAMALYIAAAAIWPGAARGFTGYNLVIAGAMIPVIALLNMANGAMRGLNRPIAAQAQEALIRPALFAGALFVLANASIRFDAKTAIGIQVAIGSMALVGCVAIVNAWIPSEVRRTRARPDAVGWTRTALSMGATEILRIFEGQFALLVLSSLSSPEEVGYYRVAAAVAAFVALPASLVNSIIIQNLASLFFARETVKLQKLLSYAALVSFVPAIFATAFVYFAGRDLLVLFFGNSFAQSWSSLAILSLAFSIISFTGCGQSLLYMCEQEGMLSRIIGSTLLLALVLAAILTPHFGASGAAWACVAMYALRGWLIWFVARTRIGVDSSPLSLLRQRFP